MLGKERIKVRSWHDRPIKSSRAAQARREAKASRLLMSCQIPEQQRKLSEPPLTVESWTKDVAKNQSVCLYKLIITRKRWSLTFSSPFICEESCIGGGGELGGTHFPTDSDFTARKPQLLRGIPEPTALLRTRGRAEGTLTCSPGPWRRSDGAAAGSF